MGSQEFYNSPVDEQGLSPFFGGVPGARAPTTSYLALGAVFLQKGQEWNLSIFNKNIEKCPE